jgi:hypothetical protein
METQSYAEMNNSFPNDSSSKREGKVARAIEEKTSKIPSDLFLWAAGASIIGSLVFQVIGMTGGKRRAAKQLMRPMRAPTSQFVGMWAPTILILGLYNKLVKVAGSDRIKN